MAGLSQDQQIRILAAELASKTHNGVTDPVDLAKRWLEFLKADDNKPKLVTPTKPTVLR